MLWRSRLVGQPDGRASSCPARRPRIRGGRDLSKAERGTDSEMREMEKTEGWEEERMMGDKERGGGVSELGGKSAWPSHLGH